MNKKYLIAAGGIFLVFVLLVILIIKTAPKKEPTQAQQTSLHTPKPGVVSQNQPTTLTEDKNQQIKIEYFPETKIIYVTIEAQTDEEYRQKVPKAVAMLKESGFDTCDKNIIWVKPTNLNKKLKASTFELIHQLTCPATSQTATPSAKP